MHIKSPQDTELGARLAGLLLAAKHGDVPAFEAFYASTVRLLLPTVKSICGSSHWEDALSDAYFQAWTSLATYDPARGGALPWIKVIARSRARDRMRAERVRNGGADGVMAYDEEDSPDPGAGPQDIMEQVQEQAVLQAAVATLPAKHQLLVRMAHDGDCTHSEISGVTGMPVGTVKTILRRSYVQLRHTLRTRAA